MALEETDNEFDRGFSIIGLVVGLFCVVLLVGGLLAVCPSLLRLCHLDRYVRVRWTY